MRSLRPEQIFLLVVFVVVPLLNLLVRWLKRRAREQAGPAPADVRPPAVATRQERTVASMPPFVRVIEPVVPRADPPEARPARRPPAVIRRAGPLGGRVAARRAVVAMTILGPCRGLEEPPITPARPAS